MDSLGRRQQRDDGIVKALKNGCRKSLSRSANGCSCGHLVPSLANDQTVEIAIRLASKESETDNQPNQLGVSDMLAVSFRDMIAESVSDHLRGNELLESTDPLGINAEIVLRP